MKTAQEKLLEKYGQVRGGRPQGVAPTGGGGLTVEPLNCEPGTILGLADLANVMKSTPVRVRVTDDRLGIFSRVENWEYQSPRAWEMFGKVSDLVFFNPAIRGALHDLPAGEYSGFDLEKIK